MASRTIVRAFPSRLISSLHTRSFSTKFGHHQAASTLALCNQAACTPRPSILVSSIQRKAGFHTTPSRQSLHLIQVLAVFKTSAGLELARTAGRIALTFVPLLWIGRVRAKKAIQYAAIHGIAISEEKKEEHARKLRIKTRVLKLLLFVPFVLFWLTIVGSLEQTPLTGRWRTILLSPDEEDEIATQLAGPGWYNAVREILASEGSPSIVPSSDWRYQWVHDTLRRLETSLPILSREPELCPNWMQRGLDDYPLPPPANHPLRPRPRVSGYLHWFCDNLTANEPETTPKPIAGPPYSLILVDKPGSSNAFSYGFGPNGGSGIVVYSGFLDAIITKNPLPPPKETPAKRSYFSWLFGDLFSSPAVTNHPKPTEVQTNELAILLAHEMAHLVLSHHLESLSSFEVVVPGALSIFSDFIRVVIFPFTAILGPFVNDAVAQLGKIGSGELAKLSEYCATKTQEIEADIVSARILAHAGFDARNAVMFWERRSDEDVECARVGKPQEDVVRRLETNITSSAHPIGQIRVQYLRSELERWEEEWRKAIDQQRKS